MSDTYVNQDYIECGFFNALEITPGVFDRVYSAETMSNPYTRLITDGIFPARPGVTDGDFKVTANGEDMDITLKAGEGIFWSKWFKLTQAQTITVEITIRNTRESIVLLLRLIITLDLVE